MRNFLPIRPPKLLRYFMLTLPLLEIILFIAAGAVLGLMPTLLLIVLTTVCGVYVLRMNGRMAVQRMQQQGQQQVALEQVATTSLLMLAGILLVIPGFITDFLGLLLLIPVIRRRVVSWLQAKHLIVTPAPSGTRDAEHIVEGEYWSSSEQKHLDDQ